jgi:hypothetical protein
MEKPTDVLETGEYIEPAQFESHQEGLLFYSYLEMLNYIEYLESQPKEQHAKWVSVSERLPNELDNCLFVVDLPHDHRHGKVYGGVYTGDSLSKNLNRRYEFSTPGISFTASEWMLSPTPPLAM